MAVCGQLDAMRQPSGQIVHKVICRASITGADKPARHKFRVRIKRNPRPHAARSAALHIFWHVLVFGINERPDFIALDALAIQVAESLVLIGGAGRAKFNQQLLNRCAVNARHADSGAERIALNQAGNHADLFFFA